MLMLSGGFKGKGQGGGRPILASDFFFNKSPYSALSDSVSKDIIGAI